MKIENTTNSYKIKIGKGYISDFRVGHSYELESEGEKVIRELKISIFEGDARTWSFNNSYTFRLDEEDDVASKNGFKGVLYLLKKEGYAFKVLKTTVFTTSEQREVEFENGEEMKDECCTPYEDEVELNKEATERSLQVAEKMGHAISEMTNSYIKFANKVGEENKQEEDVKTDGLPDSLLTDTEEKKIEINEARNILNVTLNTGMTASDINKLSKDIRMALEKVILDNKLQ